MKKHSGFSILRFLIVIAILMLFAAIGFAAYCAYVRNDAYTKIVDAAAPYRSAVNHCIQQLGTANGCDAGTNNIPNAIEQASGPIASITVKDGVITVTPVAKRGIESSDTYILTPTVTDNGTTVTWATSGGAVEKEYVK